MDLLIVEKREDDDDLEELPDEDDECINHEFKKRRLTSFVWKYFDLYHSKKDPHKEYVKCKCKKTINIEERPCGKKYK